MVLLGGHLTVKCIAALVLLITSIFFGVLPLKIIKRESTGKESCSIKSANNFKKKHKRNRDLVLGLCNCFAGGVFFSTCILDLLPMVRKKMEKALQSVDIETEFPLGEFIAAYGFLLMLITELLVHSFGKNSFLVKHPHGHGSRELKENVEEPLLNDESDENDDNYGSTDKRCKENGNGGPHLWKRPSSSVSFAIGDEDRRDVAENLSPHPPDKEPDDDDFLYSPDDGGPKSQLRRSKSLVSIETVTHSNFRIYILIIALSMHSLFEGLAVGLATEMSTLFQILIALLIHKSILAFSLGVKLLDGKLVPSAVVKGIVLFSSMAPIGMGLGLAVLSSFSSTVALFFSGILQGIATGTFLYVTFFEVLPHELNISDDNKTLKVLFVLLGFAVIAGICYYENRHYIKIPPNKTLST